jgi:uncharacterized protein YggE
MEPSHNKNHIDLHLDFRIVIGVLLVIIAAMLFVWKPWDGSVSGKDRTITVTGQATLKAAPDEFIFSPSYQFSNGDSAAALKALAAKNDEIVAALKKLGVPDNKIQTNASNWVYPTYDSNSNSTPYMLMLTITTDDKTLAQKVEDYLLSTSPSGALTPQAAFSDNKEKSLQNTARDVATKEARAKAEQSAKNLGFHLGAVKSVDDGTGFGGVIRPLGTKDSAMSASGNSAEPSIVVQPGENTLNYNVTVTYYIH